MAPRRLGLDTRHSSSLGKWIRIQFAQTGDIYAEKPPEQRK
ncbi:hypothetical protein HMPREF1546_01213 [Oscillibacter sp. KLE 1745]|nr:hypothetical protein HMPREF1546_01213 [Oscillibacter sp. KLE 1745]